MTRIGQVKKILICSIKNKFNLFPFSIFIIINIQILYIIQIIILNRNQLITFELFLLSYCRFKKIFNPYSYYYIIKLFTLAGLSMIR